MQGPLRKTVLDYRSPHRLRPAWKVDRQFWALFGAGFGAFAVVAALGWMMQSYAVASMIKAPGLLSLLLVLAFAAFVVYAHRRLKWRGSAIGAVTALGVTAIGVVVFYLWLGWMMARAFA